MANRAILKKINRKINEIQTGLSESPFLSDLMMNSSLINQYIDRIVRDGLPDNCIVCLYPDRAVSHKYISGLWIEILKLMHSTGYDVPKGVTEEGDDWIVPTFLFKPCDTCKSPLSHRCSCAKDMIFE